MPDNPMDALHKLRERLEETTAKIGLHLERFLPEPTPGEGPDVVHCIFMIDLEDVGKDAEQSEFDAQFAEITRGLEDGIERQSIEEKADTAKDDLRRLLERHQGGGFLGGGDPPAPV